MTLYDDDGVIVKILNSREVVINRGSQHGIRIGRIFQVMGETEEIKDPETGEEIGVVASVKGSLVVYEVDRKMCLARTFRKVRLQKTKKMLATNPIQEMFTPDEYEISFERITKHGGRVGFLHIEEGDAVKLMRLEESEDVPRSTVRLLNSEDKNEN